MSTTVHGRSPWRLRRAAAITTAMVIAVTLFGCSSAPSDANEQQSGEKSPEAQAALDYAYQGLGGDLTLDPLKIPEGIKAYVISCGEANSGCATGTASLVEGAKAAGWDVEIADGKLSPEGFATAIRQAVAAGADVIIPMGFGCMAAQAAFKEAHDAGIVIVGGGGPDDCDPALWAAVPEWLPDYSFDDHWALYGKLGAAWAYGATNGDARAITLTQVTNSFGQTITDGFTQELESRGGEVITNIDFSDPETVDGTFIQKVTTALLANPDATILQVPGGGFLTGGLYQAIAQSGVSNLTVVVGGPSDATTLDLIRSGSSNGLALGVTAEDSGWSQWGSIDTANRVLAGAAPAYIAQPLLVVDADHNLPASGGIDVGDWRDIYLKAWGRE
ncbi:sugar ABC transporter substrate-binding protein [Microbacterium sp. HMH0099]|uniref:sugar ABC transporter substrate-binding protein n=1 Tax=Microbacterium sp. HMH0099 TaxID=3414026 RepID=UPI003BF7AA22